MTKNSEITALVLDKFVQVRSELKFEHDLYITIDENAFRIPGRWAIKIAHKDTYVSKLLDATELKYPYAVEGAITCMFFDLDTKHKEITGKSLLHSDKISSV